MTIGRSGNRSNSNRLQIAKARRRSESRKILLESLESRQLMTVGPQLISIQPNEGDLIREGQVLNVSPNEIIVRFDDTTALDPTTIANGIQISRTGGDGTFDRAYVSSDLGTNGAVVLDFAAAVPGQTGNGLKVTFTQAARPSSRLPILTVFAQSINVEVNTTPGLETRAQDLLTAFRNNPAASAKMLVTRLRGSELTPIANTVPVGSPLILGGANTARATSNLNATSNVLVEFLAAQSGPTGLNAKIEITSRDFGGRALPVVTASGQTVRIQTNSNTQFRTTLGEFVDAINNSSAAASILQARIISGNRSAQIGVFPVNYPAIQLSGIADTLIKPGYVGLGDSKREVIIRFAEALPDDAYRIDILGQGVSPLKNIKGEPYNGGVDTSLGFVLDLGVRIESVVPQPITRGTNGVLSQALDTLHVYFNEDQLSASDAQNEQFYQLRYTNSNVSSQDDLVVYPRSAVYNAEAGRVELKFARNLNQYFNTAGGQGAFRLRIGSKQDAIKIFGNIDQLPISGPGIDTMVALPFVTPVEVSAVAIDPGSRFDTATSLSGLWTPTTAGPSAVVINSEIKNPTPYVLDFPGADSEPGNRNNRYQQHVLRTDTDGIEVIEYNFQGFLGSVNGTVQLNAITDDQKELVRRIFSLYENYLGVRFVETATRGLTVAVGDLRSVSTVDVNGPGAPFLSTGTLAFNGQPATVIDIQDFNSADQNKFGSDLFRTFARGIGNLLGLGTADELPGLTVQSNTPPVNPGIDTELVFPGNADNVYGQHAHRPEGKDIDLYRFSLPTSGKVKIEISAERLSDSSLLDSAIRLYQRDGSGWREIASNDDYFSQDSFLSLDLVAGDYILGVSAKGNQTYDPNIEDSGLGGRSEGRYELRMDFQPPENALMREPLQPNQAEGTALDGDNDGRPGGLFDFWFIANEPTSTIYVDKAAPGTGTGVGTLASPYRTISAALAAAPTLLATNAAYPNGAVVTAGQLFKSETGDVYRALRNGTSSSLITEPQRIAADIASGLMVKVNVVIRIAGNGGADGLIETPADNLAYEIGFNRLGQAQADGTTFDVPKNVTVMIDAGAIVKMTRARVGVGSTTVSVDRSGGALQVLGIPRFIDSSGRVISDLNGDPVPGSVYFTSINDTAIGRGTNRDTRPPAAAQGDWGGIDIRNQVDSNLASATRIDKESNGLFLNSIVHADVRFGGGQVIVDGVSQVITPIHMVDSRPTIANNLVTRSADAAMAATPNSFKESNFHDPITQLAGRFISDFDRVGPSIYGNHLASNTVNGLFVKTRTGAASTTEVMTVPGRFNDIDIVHVISENLIVQGSAGGASATQSSPISSTVALTASQNVDLTNGLSAGLYRYRFAFVDVSNPAAPQTGPASSPTTAVQVITAAGVNHGQVRISALPALGANQRLAIFRANVDRITGVDGEYRKVGELDAGQTDFIDQNATLGAELTTSPNTSLGSPNLATIFTSSADTRLTTALASGTYAYEFRFATGDGTESASTLAAGSVVVATSPGIANGRVTIDNLPAISFGNSLRIYRAPVVGGVIGNYALAGVVSGTTRSFIDENVPVRLTLPPLPSTSVTPPSVVGTTFTPRAATGTTVIPSGTYQYRFAFATSSGQESNSSAVLSGANPLSVVLLPTQQEVLISNLPSAPVGQTLRVYRALVPAVGSPVFELIGIAPSGTTSFLDQNQVLTVSQATSPDTSLPTAEPRLIVSQDNTPTTLPLTNALASGSYQYRFAFVSAAGESPAVPDSASAASAQVQVTASSATARDAKVLLNNLPVIPTGQSLRIYRATVTGGIPDTFYLITELTGLASTFLDTVATPGEALNDSITGPLSARTNGSLVVDPGTVLKFRSSRIEVQNGAQLLAEGLVSRPIIMTGIDDYTYGAGGTFNTANRSINATTGLPSIAPAPGNWGGLYVGQASAGSLDYVRLSYAGGTSRIDGGFASFNAIEGHQAQLRIANSRLENNADGIEDGTPVDRAGRGTNFTGTIFLRGSQPIIVDNRISDNDGAAINIDVNSLNANFIDDYGRSTGLIGRRGIRPDNQGPLIEENRLDNNAINGLLVRGQTLTTESVWDDADIVHVVRDEVISENLYTFGGLRLKSRPTTSLVVKFEASENNGLTAAGRNLDIADRIGGSVQIIGQPGFPVILTTITDDSVGAGFTPAGLPIVDTNNDGLIEGGGTITLPTGPEVDQGTLIDNDVDQSIPGFFSFQPQAGGGIGLTGSGITAQGRNQLFVNQNVIFEFLNFVDVGNDGTAVSLANTTITLPPTLIAPDLVASEGNFLGLNDEVINWRVESRFDNGIAQLFNTLTFTSTGPLGDIRYINYLDEDVLGVADDLLFTRGTPGQADFRVFTVDGVERFGFSQGGIYTQGTDLQNASYVGWAADRFADLRTAIQGPGTQYTLQGNINPANLPSINDPTLGAAFGPNDVTTAMAWDFDPTATTVKITTFLELLPQEVRNSSTPGEWRGLLFETESNDRNVAAVSEREPARTTAQAVNDLPSRGQLLGTLSSSPKSGDENARLGYQVQGTIGKPSDQDVYSFYAVGGTEVWLDIDKTANSLDSVVELIDSEGRILALSDNSFDEENDPSLLYRSTLPSSNVNPLRKTDARIFPSDSRNQPKDLYSTNPKDAGMRVVLPGPANQTTLYHVRVRSSNYVGTDDAARIAKLTDSSAVSLGRSRGAYQLQVRLREADEFPGSSISYADIRYASTGIDLAGVPRHSPLLGETAEIPDLVDNSVTPPIITDSNGSLATAQNLGNLLTTDRSTLSLAGSLSSATDVDWYSFSLDYNLQTTQLAEYFSTIFDIDYADGIGRPDTSMYLYNSSGNLISFGLNSNILDDRAGALRGADNSDLGRGSAGTNDPFIGSIELQSGQYFLAVTSQGMIPQSLAGFSNPNDGDPLLRTQPSNNSQWIVEDRVDALPSTSGLAPIVPNFVPNGSAVPFTLGDVALYVSSSNGAATNLNVVNPRTGTVTNNVGTAGTPLRDIAFRFNGDLRGFNVLPGAIPPNTDRDGLIDYWHVDDGTAAVTDIGGSNLETFRLDFTNAQAANRQEITDADVGVEFQAITFANFGFQPGNLGPEVGIAVGNRQMPAPSAEGVQNGRPETARGTNTIYRFDPNSGQALGASTFNIVDANGPDTILGNGTNINERGYIETTDTSPSRTLILPEATSFAAAAVPPTTNFILRDGDSFSLQSPGFPVFTFSYYSGPEFFSDLNPAAGRFLNDGDRFIMDGQAFEIQIAGTAPPTGGARPVNYNASMTNTEFAVALQAAMNLTGAFTNPNAIPVTVGQEGSRINFSGATTILPLAGNIRNNITLITATSTRGLFSIPFLAQDTANQIATKAAAAINAAGLGYSATVSGGNVTIAAPGFITATTGAIRQNSAASGGTITGIAVVNADNASGRIFAVSDRGGLYEVDNRLLTPTGTSGNVGTLVTTASGLIGIPFTGLTAGPRNVEGGRYANLLFATASDGRIYCFDTTGQLQPVFAGGATSVQTGIGGLNGLAFSTLDYNLWHITSQRSTDDSHGQIGTPDGIVPRQQDGNGNPIGGQSWYFGFEGPGSHPATFDAVTNPLATPRFDAGPVQNTYNFPGGALGVLESQPVSLEKVVAADSPFFYFTYYSATEDALGRDILRVRVMGDNGQWQQIAVNDLVPSQNIYNSTTATSPWRQARINLSQFVGNKEVRFRFEFSTGGGLGADRGPELRTIEAASLKDGDTFTLGGRTFEIQLGTTLSTPAGSLIPNNTSLKIGTYDFVFYDGTGPAPAVDVFTVPYNRNQTAAEVASALALAVNGAALPTNPPVAGSAVTAITVGNRVQLTGGATVTPNALFPTDNSGPGVGAGRSAVPINLDMTADQVATAVQSVLNTELAGGNNVFTRQGRFILLPGLTVVDDGPFTFTSSTGDANSAPRLVGNTLVDDRLTNNAFEGVYLDDFVIGFAERGETVQTPTTDPTLDTTFVRVPGRAGSINVGPYQLEIRGGEDYLVPQPVGIRPVYKADGSFATNERLSEGSTIRLTGSDNIVHGDVLSISDGLKTLKFVFRNVAVTNPAPLNSDEVAVPFSTSIVNSVTGVRQAESGAVIASRLRDLINSPAIQSRLNVTAISLNGAVSGLGGDGIALSSNAIVTSNVVAPRIPIVTVDVQLRRGDTNTPRDQGQIIIENSKISDSANFGIRLRADQRETDSNNPNPGSTRNTVVINNERLAPGAVIVNNELTGNLLGGISIEGDIGATTLSPASVPFARILNNTIVGGTINQPTTIIPGVFNDMLFSQGSLAFADLVPTGGYTPNFSGGPVPLLGLDQPNDALGIPNYTGDPLSEPFAGQGVVSLGNGGRLVVEFTDNILTGSGDSQPDLAIFEVGLSERAAVEVSSDGVTYTSVGYIDGQSPMIDLDFYGFDRDSRLRFVRVTDDVLDGPTTGDSVGADIDAVGALSSIAATSFLPGGVGIQVGPNASPTLLNNILVNNVTGISVDATSSSTVIGGSVYLGNTANVPVGGSLGQFPLSIPPNSELFVDAYNRRFYPKNGAATIDSSVDSLLDRAGLVSVKTPLGLQASPILAPGLDLNGQLRVDDPTIDSPSGLGENVFKDRGAQDRSDFTGPTAVVIDPTDNDLVPADINPLSGIVELKGNSQPYFDIRLFDGGDLQQSSSGTGVDPLTVNSASIMLVKDGVILAEGIDYRFGFDATSNVMRLTPIGGVWPADSVYEVRFIEAGQSIVPFKSVSDMIDGTTYTIVYDMGSDGFKRFELDLGVILAVPTATNGTTHGVVDGGVFTLTQGLQVVQFEFDDNGVFATNSIPISLLATDTPALVVNKMIAAVQASGLFANANALSNNRIQMIGDGLVLTDLTANLIASGNGGVLPGTIAVPLDANLANSPQAVAAAFADAVRNAGLPGINATSIGPNVLIEGAISVVGIGSIVVQQIADRAGNPLRENQDDGTTVLVIQIGSGLDYGDAPQPNYISNKTSDGPRHSVIEGFYLGAGATADADARPNNTDADDGVLLSGDIVQGYSSQLTVTASGISVERPGYLSAWIDFNGNGSFEDAERITTSTNDTLINGNNIISFNVPGSARSGSTFGRFRYSSTRNLTSIGEAVDGEVEDWSINIVGNPYTNQANNLDVNQDTFVSPIDALQVINYLARSGSSSTQLVIPRVGGAVKPFIDVNGDGFASPIDVLLVINAINRQSRGEGEGIGTGSDSTWIPASQAVTSFADSIGTGTVLSSTPTQGPLTVLEKPAEIETIRDSDSFESPLANRQDSAWASVDGDDDSLETSWLDERELSGISRDSDAASKPRSLHDCVFADLEEIGLL